MNFKSFFAGAMAVMLVSGLVLSCSMPNAENPVAERRVTEIPMAFAGGSYSVEEGLAPGAALLVRLGTVVQLGKEFVDNTADARFGLLTVKEIGEGAVSFDFAHFDAKGKQGATSTHSLSLGGVADLNGDGVTDVIFGLQGENASLFFVSSYVELKTTLFFEIPAWAVESLETDGLNTKVLAEGFAITFANAEDFNATSDVMARYTKEEIAGAIVLCVIIAGMLVYGALL
jgi:hypothetical protein